jgi:hypothetical protein
MYPFIVVVIEEPVINSINWKKKVLWKIKKQRKEKTAS